MLLLVAFAYVEFATDPITDPIKRIEAKMKLAEIKANLERAEGALAASKAILGAAKATLAAQIENQAIFDEEREFLCGTFENGEILNFFSEGSHEYLMAAFNAFNNVMAAVPGATKQQLARAQQQAEEAALQSKECSVATLQANNDARLLADRAAAYEHAQHVADRQVRFGHPSVKNALGKMKVAHEAYVKSKSQAKHARNFHASRPAWNRSCLDDLNDIELLYATHPDTCLSFRRPYDRGVFYCHEPLLCDAEFRLDDRDKVLEAARRYVFNWERLGESNALGSPAGLGQTRVLDQVARHLRTLAMVDAMVLTTCCDKTNTALEENEAQALGGVLRVLATYFCGYPTNKHENTPQFAQKLNQWHNNDHAFLAKAIDLLEKRHKNALEKSAPQHGMLWSVCRKILKSW